jgi:CheY-like chemotaxis protein
MNRVTCLLIDDDLGIRIVIPRMLAALGVTVLTASTFSEAIAIMATIPAPDFIFLDLGLPDTTSKLETMEHIADLKAFNPSAPVVILTGDNDNKLEQMGRTLGADSFKLKKDLTGQRDLWLSMKEAIDSRVQKGDTPTEAMTKILAAISSKMEVPHTA